MGNSAARLLIGGLLAVLVPGIILHEAAGAERHAAGMTAAPFALPRVLAAHLVAVLPIGLILGGRVRAKLGGEFSPTMWALIGLAVAGVAAYFSPNIGESLVSADVGPSVALLVRCVFAFLLVFPWCVAAGFVSGPLGRLEVAIGLLVAIVPPGAYCAAVTSARSQSASDLLARGRFARAEVVVRGLVELGSDVPIDRKNPLEAKKAIAAKIESLRKQVERPLPANASPRARAERAVDLIALHRNDEAIELLEPLVADTPAVSLLLGHAYQEVGKRAESEAALEAALAKLLPTVATDPDARALCVEAFGTLAQNAKADRRYDEVERILRRGLEAIPAEAAYFHFELGKLYSDGGRPAKALEELQTAVKLDPEKYRGPAEGVTRHIRTHTYGCMLSPSSAGQPASRNP